ncbi:MAG: hypothetical protein ACO1N0_03905 [Fluviicola sp.]
MKRNLFALLLMLLFVAASCSKTKTGMVVRDCTGVYLQINGKDYRVCNIEKISNYKHGQEIKASYKEISDCDGTANDQPVCFMLHEYESWIEITKVK